MMKKPLVSVVIPVYNGDKYLRETIETVIKQDYRPLEIIVVDDGSSDGSATIAQSFKEVHYIQQKNQGNAVARDNGIKNAQGEFIALLDQDDLWAEEKISVHIDYLRKHPEIVLTSAHFKHFLKPGMKRPSWCREELLNEEHPDYAPSSLVARKKVFEMVGTFSSDYKTASDTDWLFRAKDKQLPMAVIPQLLVYRRVHDSNQSNLTRQAHQELLKLVRKSVHRKTGKEDGRSRD